MKVKRLHLLLGVLTLLAGSAGGLYHAGYFDSWADKKAEVKQLLIEQIDAQGAELPAEMKEKYVDCAAEKLVELAASAECELDGLAPVMPQLEQCLQESGAAQLVPMIVMICAMQAQQ